MAISSGVHHFLFIAFIGCQRSLKKIVKNFESDVSSTPDITMPFHLPQWLRCLINQTSEAEDLNTILDTLIPALRESLAMDRVILCQFESENQVQVIAESRIDNRLPSLLQSHFQADYISPYSQEVWQTSRIGAAVDLGIENIYQFSWTSDALSCETKNFPVNTQQKNNLEDIGAQFSLIIPVFKRDKIFGLLITHRIERTVVYNNKIELLKTVVEQLSVAIDQQILRTQAQKKDKCQAELNLLNSCLQADSGPNFQRALELAVSAFQASGGRLCMSNADLITDEEHVIFSDCLQQSSKALSVYSAGVQPELPSSPDSLIMEQYPLWQTQNSLGKYEILPISNIYETPQLSPLFNLFQSTPIMSMLMIPLTYGQQLLGYLSLFRNESGLNSQHGQSVLTQVWEDELEQAQRLGDQISAAIHKRDSLKKQAGIQTLVGQGQKNVADLERLTQKQQGLFTLLGNIAKGKTNLEKMVRASTKELCHLLEAERVSVYKFDEHWGGEFLHDLEYVVPAWKRLTKLGKNTVWNDSYLQDTKGGRYRHDEVSAVNDIYQANLSSCHIEILEQFGFKAFAIAPIFVGDHLWGLLGVYQQSTPRNWQDSEIGFLQQTATALGLAIEKVELLTQLDRMSSKIGRL